MVRLNQTIIPSIVSAVCLRLWLRVGASRNRRMLRKGYDTLNPSRGGGLRLGDTNSLRSPLPNERSVAKEVKWVIVGASILQVILWSISLPIVEVDVSKYEILDQDCQMFSSERLPYTVCKLTIQDKGVGGVYYVETEAGGRTATTTRSIDAGGVGEIRVFFYHILADDCSYTVDAPDIREMKSPVQILAGG